MAFADATNSLYVVRNASFWEPLQVKAATTIKKGQLVGYNSGWVLADSSDGIPARFVALHDAGAGEMMNVSPMVSLEGPTGATPGGALYVGESGGYLNAAGTTDQIVGISLSATLHILNLTPYLSNIPFASLANLDSTYLLVGSSGNVAVKRAITGDVTIGNTGVTAIGANKVTAAMCKAAVKTNFLRGPVWDIDTAAGGASTLDVVLLKPTVAITITKVRIVYDVETSGTVAAGSIQLGSAAGGEQYVTASNGALENSKAVGYEKNVTITSGAITAGQAIFCRFTGVAATAAGSIHLELEYTVDDV